MDEENKSTDKSGKGIKSFLFNSRTFNSKLFLKLTSSIMDPSIICIQTLRYEQENRKLFEIELAIPYLQTFPELMKFINLEETPKSSRKLLIELTWFLFYKYYKKNIILKKASEKQEFYYILLNGKILKLNLVFERQSLTLEEYLVYLFKLKLIHEKEILKKCRLLNNFYADIDGENLNKFFKENPQFKYEKIKEKAKKEIINLGFKLEDFQEEDFPKINSVENYLKITIVKKNVKSLSDGIRATPKFYIGKYEKAGYITKGQSIGNLTPDICSDNSTYICMTNCDIVYLNKRNSKTKLKNLYNLIIQKKKRILSDIKKDSYIFSQINEQIFQEEIIRHFEYKQFNEGEKIFIQGSIFEGLYFIKKGKVKIYLNSSINEVGNCVMNIKNCLNGFREYISNIKNNNSIIDEESIRPKIINDKINLDREQCNALNDIKKYDILTILENSIFGTNELYDYKTGIYFFSAECLTKEAIIYFLPKKFFYSLLVKEKQFFLSLAELVEFKIRDIIGKLKYHIKCFDSIMNKNSGKKLNTFNTLNKNDLCFNNFMNALKIKKSNIFHQTITLNRKVKKSYDLPKIVNEKNNNTIKESNINNYILTETIKSYSFKDKFHKSFRDSALNNNYNKIKLLTPSRHYPINLIKNKKSYPEKIFLSAEKKEYIKNIKINLPSNFPFNVQNSYYKNTTFLIERNNNLLKKIIIK